MTTEQYLLTKVMEECAEIIERASKAQRFGLEQVQSGQDQTNCQRLIEEFLDLIAVLEMLNIIPDFNADVNINFIEDKKKKVLYYMNFSRLLGVLDK